MNYQVRRRQKDWRSIKYMQGYWGNELLFGKRGSNRMRRLSTIEILTLRSPFMILLRTISVLSLWHECFLPFPRHPLRLLARRKSHSCKTRPYQTVHYREWKKGEKGEAGGLGSKFGNRDLSSSLRDLFINFTVILCYLSGDAETFVTPRDPKTSFVTCGANVLKRGNQSQNDQSHKKSNI